MKRVSYIIKFHNIKLEKNPLHQKYFKISEQIYLVILFKMFFTNGLQRECLINWFDIYESILICQGSEMFDQIINSFFNWLQHGFQFSRCKSWTQNFSQ